MRARLRLTEAALKLEPLRQGELDGLCGLYAVINAVRLAVYPRRLHKPEIKLLFEAGVRVLSTTRRLRCIIADGMYDDLWERMTKAVLAQLALDREQALVLDDLLAGAKVRSTDDAHRVIRHAVYAGRPAIVSLLDSYNHWTVISSYTPTRYYLFDSWGYRWIGIAKVALDDSEDVAFHRLARAFALQRVE